jgi:hypothetical protein
MENHTDELARAHAILTALRDNVPKDRDYVDEDYVHEYHEALDHLGRVGFDMKEFEIPPQWMEPITRLVPEGDDHYNPMTYGLRMAGSRTHQVPEGDGYRTINTGRSQVELAKFMTRLDAALKHINFSLASADSPKGQQPIGFTGPRKK